MRNLVLLTSTAVAAFLQLPACSNQDCTVTKTCPVGSAGSGASSSEGGASSDAGPSVGGSGGATSGPSGPGGGTAETCGNGQADPGEICFPATGTEYETGGQETVSLHLFDCDGDGDLDIVTAHANATISTLRNDGGNYTRLTHDGPFLPVNDSAVGTLATEAGWSDSGNPSNMSGQYFVSATFGVETGDYDGNGTEDVLVANETELLVGIAGDFGADGFLFAHTQTEPRAFYRDLNADFRTDLLLLEPSTRRLSWGTAAGKSWSFGAGQSTLTGVSPTSLAVGDLDGDADVDVVVTNSGGGSLSLLVGDGAGALSPLGSEVPVAAPGVSEPTGVAIADLDGDGAGEVIVADAGVSAGASTVAIFANDGGGGLRQLELRPSVHQQASMVAVGDLDGDGRPDIVTASPHVDGSSSKVTVLLAES